MRGLDALGLRRRERDRAAQGGGGEDRRRRARLGEHARLGMEGFSTDAAILDGARGGAARDPRRRRRGGGVQAGASARARVRAEGRVAARRGGRDLVVNATPVRDEVLVRAACRARRSSTSPYPRTATAEAAARRRRARPRRPRGARRAGRRLVRALDRDARARCRHARRRRLACVTLELATAGESHGPALVAILSGLPAGLVLDRAAIDADLRRRQQGYGRSPRQQIETDEVEVLAGLRHGRTLGTPLALVVRNRDHKNWTWGMSPWPPEGEPEGKGTKAVTLPRPGHADLAGVAEVRARRRPRRARARVRAPHRRPRRRRRGGEGAARGDRNRGRRARALPRAGADPAAVDAARKDKDTLGGVVEVRARRRTAGPRVVRAAGGPARRAARGCGHGHPGGEGRRDRRRLRARRAARLRGARRDRPGGCADGRTAPAGSRPGCRTARRSSYARR